MPSRHLSSLCDGSGPIRHPAGECPWCDQAKADELRDRIIEAKLAHDGIHPYPALEDRDDDT